MQNTMNILISNFYDLVLKAGYYLVVITVFMIPLFSEAHIRFGGTSFVNILLVPLSFLIIVSLLIRPVIKKSIVILMLVLLAMAVCYIVAGRSSPWFLYSDMGIFYTYITRAVFLLSFLWFVRTEKQLNKVLTIVISGSLIAALVSILRWWQVFPYESIYISEEYGIGERNMGTFIISGSYALWQGLGWAIMLTRIQRNRSIFENIFYVISIGFLFISALFVAESRNAIMFFVMVSWIIIFYRQFRKKGVDKLFAIFFLLVAAGVLVWLAFDGFVSERIVITARFTLIYSAIEYIKLYPIYGVGLSVFRDFLSPRFQSVHNAFFDLMVESGILSVFLFSFLLLYIFAKFFSAINKYSYGNDLYIGLIVATFFSIQFFPAQLSYPLWLILGIVFLKSILLYNPEKEFTRADCLYHNAL